jgi:hypothetical protein
MRVLLGEAISKIRMLFYGSDTQIAHAQLR